MDEDDEGHDYLIPRVTFKVYTPLSQEQYEVILDVGNYDITYYMTLADLIKSEGPEADYTEDNIPLYDDLYAN